MIMPKVSYIVARTKNNVIGCNNDLPWRLSSDLRRFRQITSGSVIIMGRKTFESIGKPLPNRVSIVISRNNSFEADNLIFCKDLSTAIFVGDIISNIRSMKEMFIIGGEQIFNSMKNYVSKVYLTEIQDDEIVGDSYFNMEFGKGDWSVKHKEFVKRSELDQFDYEFRILEKKRRPIRTRSALNVVGKAMPEAELFDLIKLRLPVR
ncbi:dihydrofolate reductase [Ancylobacter sp. TS-1]|uniref:dihydrofolate reductase n=1 Tax=Ancylobacter sp. TS-1 TaxID=1850374 RepID=UPI0013913CB8|nr:dihydrofolate reductase [Ancylobacter sp. TS-1]